VKTLAVIPAHNEALSLPTVVAELRRIRPDIDLLVVDDGSKDDTEALLRGMGVATVALGSHQGIGAAIRAGLQHAAVRGYDTVIRVDADGQHPASEISRLLEALAGGSDAAVGSRYLENTAYPMTAGRRWIHRLLAWGLSGWMGRKVTDPTSGFWAFNRPAIRFLAQTHPEGYGEPQLFVLLAQCGLTLREVPVHMRRRFAGKTSLTVGRGLRAAVSGLFALSKLALLPAVLTTPRPTERADATGAQGLSRSP
jgi:glycosyltransferase involved in cell wall biosynthesis